MNTRQPGYLRVQYAQIARRWGYRILDGHGRPLSRVYRNRAALDRAVERRLATGWRWAIDQDEQDEQRGEQ